MEKVGRATTAILFTMNLKTVGSKDENLITSIKEKLKFYGVNNDSIEELIVKHDEQYLLANLKIVEEQLQKGEIQNVTGYLLKAFQTDFRI